MRELFDLKIGLGSVSALQRRVSERLAEPVAQALEFVRQQTLQCVDETGWQENSRLNWLWVNCTKRVTVFQIRSGRGQTDARTIIDEEETGVITTDRYPGDNFLQGWRRQICWAQLKRDFVAMTEREDVQSKDISESCRQRRKRCLRRSQKCCGRNIATLSFALSNRTGEGASQRIARSRRHGFKREDRRSLSNDYKVKPFALDVCASRRGRADQ